MGITTRKFHQHNIAWLGHSYNDLSQKNLTNTEGQGIPEHVCVLQNKSGKGNRERLADTLIFLSFQTLLWRKHNPDMLSRWLRLFCKSFRCQSDEDVPHLHNTALRGAYDLWDFSWLSYPLKRYWVINVQYFVNICEAANPTKLLNYHIFLSLMPLVLIAVIVICHLRHGPGNRLLLFMNETSVLKAIHFSCAKGHKLLFYSCVSTDLHLQHGNKTIRVVLATNTVFKNKSRKINKQFLTEAL